MNNLIALAAEVRKRAYAPYSHFHVGAALLAKNGKTYTGCNVENISYGLTICAERGAIMAAVADGATEFEAIAIVTDSKVPTSPCGACRQVLAEFAPAMKVILSTTEGLTTEFSLEELFPRAKTGILDAQ